MKKILFSLIALSAIMASCSKSETLEYPNQDKAIAFDPYTGRVPISKAPSIESVEQFAPYGFQVYGYLNNNNGQASYVEPYMDKVVKGEVNGEKTTWSYDGVSYWPGTIPLDFVAYGLNTNLEDNTDDDALVAFDATSVPTITYTVNNTVALQRDLLVANPVNDQKFDNTTDGKVSLTFNHMLSRISFSLVTKDENTIPVTIEQVDLVGKFITSGTVDLTQKSPKIVGTESTTDVTYKFLGEKGTFTSTAVDASKKSINDPIYDNSLSYFKVGYDSDKAIDRQDKAYYEPIYSYISNDDTIYVVKRSENYYTATKSGDTWTVSESPVTIPEETTIGLAFANENAAKKDNRYMMIIPTENHSAKLKVKYFLPYAGSYDADENGIDLKDIKFEAGKSYEFRLKVSTNEIGFDVIITPWDEGSYGEGDNNQQIIELN